MAKKEQFDFVNDMESDIDIVEETTVNEDKISEERKNKSKEIQDAIRNSRRYILKKYAKAAVVMLVVSAIIVYLLMLWQDDYTLMAWGDAFWVAFILEFFVAWLLLVYNLNILSPVMYGYKAFFLMFLGKKQKLGYYEYMQNVEDNPIPKFFIIVIFTSSFVLFIPALITLLMLT